MAPPLHRDGPPTLLTRTIGSSLTERATPGTRQRWFRLCTNDIDGHGSIIRPGLVDLTEHKQNPVLLWGHWSSRNAIGEPPPPDAVIGHVADYDQTDDHLDILCDFDEDKEDVDALCNKVWRRVEKGLIRACSIGCIPTVEPEMKMIDGQEVPVYTRTTLKEASVVILGSNKNALMLSRDAAMAILDGSVTPDEIRAAPIVQRMGKSGRERQVTQIASVAVFDRRGRLLFGKRRDNGKWTLIGGHLEAGESSLDGARRELLEETGIDLPVDRLTPIGSGHAGDYLIHCFRADLEEDHLPIGLIGNDHDPDEELSEFRWVSKPPGEVGTASEDAERVEVLGNLHAPRNVTLALLGWQDGAGIVDLKSAPAERDLDRGRGSSSGGKHGDEDLGDGDDDDDEDPDDDDEDEDDERKNRAVASPTALIEQPAVVAEAQTRDGESHYSVVAHKKFPTVDGAWDASAAVRRWARWASRDGSGDRDQIDWHKFSECFVFFDFEDPGLTAGKLPHHDIEGGRPVTVWRGVVAAAAALQGARGGVGDLMTPALVIAGRAHLSAEYREFGKIAPWENTLEGIQVRIAGGSVGGSGGSSSGKKQLDHDPMDRKNSYRRTKDSRYKVGNSYYEFHDQAVSVAEKHGLTVHHLYVRDQSDLLTLRAADYRGIDFSLAPGVKSALRQGLDWVNQGHAGDGLTEQTLREARQLIGNGAWWDDKARRANAWFARHGALGHAKESGDRPTPYGVAWSLWGGDAGRAQVAQICAEMGEKDASARVGAMRGLMGHEGVDAAILLRDLTRGGELYALCEPPPYLPHSNEGAASIQRDGVPAVGSAPASLFTSVIVPIEPQLAPPSGGQGKGPNIMPHLSKEHRHLHRDLIAHKLDGAEMHAEAHDSLPAEHTELRGLHRDMCRSVLKDAEEMHRAFVASHPHGGEEGGMLRDDDEGEMRAVPSVKDEEMKRSFAAVYAGLGKLPRTPATICRDALGTRSATDLFVKIDALKDDRTALVEMRKVQRRDQNAVMNQQREDLINHWQAPERAIIDPAKAQQMRGYDPATGQPNGRPWSLPQIQQYVTERAPGGPVAEITRTAPLSPASPVPGVPTPGALPLQPAGAPALGWQPSGLIRMGTNDPSQAVDFAAGANQAAQMLGRSQIPGMPGAAGPSAAAIFEVAAKLHRKEMVFNRPAAGMPNADAGEMGRS